VLVKFAWNRFPPAGVKLTNAVVPLKVMVAFTLSIPSLSVMFAVMITTSLWLKTVSFVGWVKFTCGVTESFPTTM